LHQIPEPKEATSAFPDLTPLYVPDRYGNVNVIVITYIQASGKCRAGGKSDHVYVFSFWAWVGRDEEGVKGVRMYPWRTTGLEERLNGLVPALVCMHTQVRKALHKKKGKEEEE